MSDVENSIDQIAREKSGTSRPLTRFLFALVAKLSRRRWIIRRYLIGNAQSYMIMSASSED